MLKKRLAEPTDHSSVAGTLMTSLRACNVVNAHRFF